MARTSRGRADRGAWLSPDDLIAELRRRSRTTLRDRWHRFRSTAILAVQSAIAAALSWLIANNLLHHHQPIFAPISALITLDISVGQRFRRAAELVFGVALGIGLGDGLIYVIGTGFWQVGLVVFLATVLTVFVGGTSAVVAQAASSAVLVATLSPPKFGIAYNRFYDALIGGGAALVVMALVLPANPLTTISRKATPPINLLADGLDATAQALRSRQASLADHALSRMKREGGIELSRLRESVPEGRETVTVAPLRWRSRGALAQYVEAADYIERAMANAQVLARRAVTAIYDGEPSPDRLPSALATLAEATRELLRALNRASNPERTAELAVEAVCQASEAHRSGLGFSGGVLFAQVRAIATDLLGAAGFEHSEANELVRRACGNPAER